MPRESDHSRETTASDPGCWWEGRGQPDCRIPLKCHLVNADKRVDDYSSRRKEDTI